MLLGESSRQPSRVPDYEPPFQLPTLGPLRDLLGRAPTELADAAIAEFGGPVVPSLAALAAEAYTRPEDLDRLSAFMAHALPVLAQQEPAEAELVDQDEVLARYKEQIDFVALLKAYDHPFANDLMSSSAGSTVTCSRRYWVMSPSSSPNRLMTPGLRPKASRWPGRTMTGCWLKRLMTMTSRRSRQPVGGVWRKVARAP